MKKRTKRKKRKSKKKKKKKKKRVYRSIPSRKKARMNFKKALGWS